MLMLPHLSLFVLGDKVTVEVLQGHFGHGDPLLCVVTHGWAWALASHCHALPKKIYGWWCEQMQQYVHSTIHPLSVQITHKSCSFRHYNTSAELNMGRMAKEAEEQFSSYSTEYTEHWVQLSLRSWNYKMTVDPEKEEGKTLALLPEQNNSDNIVTVQLWRNKKEIWFLKALMVELYCGFVLFRTWCATTHV